MGKRRRLEALRRLGAKLCSRCLRATAEFVPVKRLSDGVMVRDLCGECADRVADENVDQVEPALQPLLRALQHVGRRYVAFAKKEATPR